MLCESAVDALSYHQLNNKADLRYASMGGCPSEKGLETIAKLKNSGLKEVIIAYDNDKRGKEIAEMLSCRLANRNIKVKLDLPSKEGADWNDMLKEQLRKPQEKYKWVSFFSPEFDMSKIPSLHTRHKGSPRRGRSGPSPQRGRGIDI